jgi:hypothetical protein
VNSKKPSNKKDEGLMETDDENEHQPESQVLEEQKCGQVAHSIHREPSMGRHGSSVGGTLKSLSS